jgi:hypothetical protein
MDELDRLRRFQPVSDGIGAAREQAARDLRTAIGRESSLTPKRHRASRGRPPALVAVAARGRSRRVVVAVVVVIAAIGVGVSYAAVELLSGGSRTLLAETTVRLPGAGAVRGLAPWAANVSEPGPTPTVAQCTTLWNAHAPESSRRWLAAYATQPALVRVDTLSSFPTPGGATTSYCSLQVFLGPGKELTARAPYRADTSGQWQGLVRPIPAGGSFERMLLGRFDAVVTADGTIRRGG